MSSACCLAMYSSSVTVDNRWRAQTEVATNVNLGSSFVRHGWRSERMASQYEGFPTAMWSGSLLMTLVFLTLCAELHTSIVSIAGHWARASLR